MKLITRILRVPSAIRLPDDVVERLVGQPVQVLDKTVGIVEQAWVEDGYVCAVLDVPASAAFSVDVLGVPEGVDLHPPQEPWLT